MWSSYPWRSYIPSFIEIRSWAAEPQRVEFCSFPLLWLPYWFYNSLCYHTSHVWEMDFDAAVSMWMLSPQHIYAYCDLDHSPPESNQLEASEYSQSVLSNRSWDNNNWPDETDGRINERDSLKHDDNSVGWQRHKNTMITTHDNNDKWKLDKFTRPSFCWVV